VHSRMLGSTPVFAVESAPMSAKRALIVDDSRSARVILSRMLETYGLTVDASESGEQAIEYLRSNHPDVIFMDHLMPGMDGFEALRAIKNVPESAGIPILMYTSQEGDLYASQARALGAVGVVPKTVKQVDVMRVLYQLHLLTERREGHAVGAPVAKIQAANESTAPRAIPPPRTEEPSRTPPNPWAAALQEQNAELRRFILASLEAFGRRVTTDIKGVSTPAQPADPIADLVPPPRPSRLPIVVAVTLTTLILSVAFGVVYWRLADSVDALTVANSRLAGQLADQSAQLGALNRQISTQIALAAAEPRPDAVATSFIPPVPPATPSRQTELVPYGEAPLTGARLEKLRELLDRLRQQNFKGTVRATTFIGDFCLVGSGIEGFAPAADDVPAKRCDVTGNPFEDGLSSSQRQSVGFANLAASARQESGGAINVVLTAQGRRVQAPYPETSEKLTAGEWNRIASRNNRVEFSTEPAR
jgi:CheY-like chemotaxis protein